MREWVIVLQWVLLFHPSLGPFSTYEHRGISPVGKYAMQELQFSELRH